MGFHERGDAFTQFLDFGGVGEIHGQLPFDGTGQGCGFNLQMMLEQGPGFI
ncbi:hypothetical protein D3C78_1621920 [compost metagenome]